MIQRRLKIGYSHAAILLDRMEKEGIVGPFAGSRARSILITQDQWSSMKSPVFSVSALTEDTSESPTIDCTSGLEIHNCDIKIHDFPAFLCGDVTLCIEDNQIRISKSITTMSGSSTTTISFNGKNITSLVLKKPRLFSSGYIQFKLKPNVNIISNNSDLFPITSENFSDVLQIGFKREISTTITLFAQQISQDIGIPLEE